MIHPEILEAIMADPFSAPLGDSSFQERDRAITALLQYGLDDLRQTLIELDMAQASHVELSLVICPYDGPELRLLELLETGPYAGNLRAIHEEGRFHLLAQTIASHSRYPRIQHFRAIGPMRALSAHRRLEMITRLSVLSAGHAQASAAPKSPAARATAA